MASQLISSKTILQTQKTILQEKNQSNAINSNKSMAFKNVSGQKDVTDSLNAIADNISKFGKLDGKTISFSNETEIDKYLEDMANKIIGV